MSNSNDTIESFLRNGENMYRLDEIRIRKSFSYPFSTVSEVGTTCFHHVVIKIRQLFIRPVTCLNSILLETGVATNGTNDLLYLPKHEGARDNKF
jgi:hypothetical protein